MYANRRSGSYSCLGQGILVRNVAIKYINSNFYLFKMGMKLQGNIKSANDELLGCFGAFHPNCRQSEKVKLSRNVFNSYREMSLKVIVLRKFGFMEIVFYKKRSVKIIKISRYSFKYFMHVRMGPEVSLRLQISKSKERPKSNEYPTLHHLCIYFRSLKKKYQIS